MSKIRIKRKSIFFNFKPIEFQRKDNPFDRAYFFVLYK